MPAGADLVDAASLEDVVSIQCYGRSGSIFLASLLDSHPQVLMLPGVQLSAFYEFWRQHGELPAIQTLGTFLANFKAIYQVHQPNNVPIFGEKPFGDRPSPVDGQRLSDTMLRLIARKVDDVQTMPVPRKYFFQALHAAYAIALGRDVRWDKAVIVYSLHEPLAVHASPFSKDFPNARYLHAVREPIRSLDSWYRMALAIRKYDSPFPVVGMMNMLTQAAPMFGECAARSAAVRLEDLHTRSRETLERICDWAGLEWDDCLMRSTFNGIDHTDSETADGKALQGFQTHTISRKNYLCCRWLDAVRLRVLYANVYRAWKYPLPAIYRSAVLQGLVRLLMPVPFRVEQLAWKRDDEKFSFTKLGFKIDRYLELRRLVLAAWRADRAAPDRYLKLL